MTQNFGATKLGEPSGLRGQHSGAQEAGSGSANDLFRNLGNSKLGGPKSLGDQQSGADSQNSLVGEIKQLIHKLQVKSALQSLEDDLQQMQQSPSLGGNSMDSQPSQQLGSGSGMQGDLASELEYLLQELSGGKAGAGQGSFGAGAADSLSQGGGAGPQLGSGSDTQNSLMGELENLIQQLSNGNAGAGQSGLDPGAGSGAGSGVASSLSQDGGSGPQLGSGADNQNSAMSELENLIQQLEQPTPEQRLEQDLQQLLQLMSGGNSGSGQSSPSMDSGAGAAGGIGGASSPSNFGASSPTPGGNSTGSLPGQQLGSPSDAQNGLQGGDVDLQKLEQDLQQLIQLLEGGNSGSGQSSPSADSGAAPASGQAGGAPGAPAPSQAGAAPASGTPSAPASSQAGATPASGTPGVPASGQPSAAPASGNGQTVNIDGGNASGHGVTEEVDNNTGKAQRFGFVNSQGKVAGELDLAAGAKGSFNVNADGPDGKSARIDMLNADGSVPAEENLDETNIATNPNGSLQVSDDVSGITKGNDATKISITDGKGDKVGDGAFGGSYTYPTQDTLKDPALNPMRQAMDTSNKYVNDFR